MSPEPRVDIVMRTKNRPVFLARAIDDVLAQEYPHWHLIVVNDGGDPDPVQALLAERPRLEGRITVQHLPESVGRGAAVIPGIEAGRSPLIAIHDDDDTWHREFLKSTVAHLQATDDVAVAVRTAIVWEVMIGDKLQETGREVFHPLMQEPTYFDLLRFNHVVPISVLYRRSVHNSIDIDPSLRSVFDWDFNMQLWQAGTVGFLDGEPLAFWRQRRGARGDAANSVIAESDSHILFDRRVRDEALRDYVGRHGSGDLLYLAKYVDERRQEIDGRLDRVQQRYDEISRLLRDR